MYSIFTQFSTQVITNVQTMLPVVIGLSAGSLVLRGLLHVLIRYTRYGMGAGLVEPETPAAPFDPAAARRLTETLAEEALHDWQARLDARSAPVRKRWHRGR